MVTGTLSGGVRIADCDRTDAVFGSENSAKALVPYFLPKKAVARGAMAIPICEGRMKLRSNMRYGLGWR